MVVCVRVKNTFYSIICSFASILKLLDLFFPCFPSVTRRSDIDECSSGSHDCHQNATCVNTAGHYDCICKPGLTGNGRNCSGEAIIFFHLSNDNRGSPPPPSHQPPSSSQESLVTITRAGAHQMQPPSPLISWVNPFPCRFINRTVCFPRKVSFFRKSRMSRWKNKIGWSRTQKPVLRPFSFFTIRPFLQFYSRWDLGIMK